MITLASACLGCLALVPDTAMAQQEPSTAGWPAWLVEAMQVEERRLEWSGIELGDGAFRSRIAGKPDGDPVEIEGGWVFTTDLGSEAPLECWVFTTGIDPAALAANIANLSIESVAETSGPVGARNIHFVDAGAFGASPYLALEWLFTVGEAPNVLVGLSKVRVAVIDELTVACSHNMLGYRETFQRAFEEFVVKAEIGEAFKPHFFAEVYRMSVGEQPIGIVRTTFSLDEDGDTRAVTMDSTLMPVDATNLAANDTWTTSFSRPDGSLITSIQAMSENGQLTLNLRLDGTEDGGWWVSGMLQGKEIDANLTTDNDPVSEVAQMRAVRDLIASDDRSSVTMNTWLPEADPLRTTPATFDLDPERGKQGYGTLKMGPIVMDTNFDEHGSIEDARMQIGGNEVSLDRLWTEGTPP